jgi:Lar family restriction alleviation protein
MTGASIELTPDDQSCPFCGAPGNYAMARSDDGEWLVECIQCGASGPPMKRASEAVDAWNTRLDAAAGEPDDAA